MRTLELEAKLRAARKSGAAVLKEARERLEDGLAADEGL